MNLLQISSIYYNHVLIAINETNEAKNNAEIAAIAEENAKIEAQKALEKANLHFKNVNEIKKLIIKKAKN